MWKWFSHAECYRFGRINTAIAHLHFIPIWTLVFLYRKEYSDKIVLTKFKDDNLPNQQLNFEIYAIHTSMLEEFLETIEIGCVRSLMLWKWSADCQYRFYRFETIFSPIVHGLCLSFYSSYLISHSTAYSIAPVCTGHTSGKIEADKWQIGWKNYRTETCTIRNHQFRNAMKSLIKLLCNFPIDSSHLLGRYSHTISTQTDLNGYWRFSFYWLISTLCHALLRSLCFIVVHSFEVRSVLSKSTYYRNCNRKKHRFTTVDSLNVQLHFITIRKKRGRRREGAEDRKMRNGNRNGTNCNIIQNAKPSRITRVELMWMTSYDQ